MDNTILTKHAETGNLKQIVAILVTTLVENFRSFSEKEF